MGVNTYIQQNDVGVAVQIQIVQNDGKTPVNLSTDTGLTIDMYRPDGSNLSYPASFVNSGSDGLIQYISQSGDFSIAGLYKIQAAYLVGGNIKHTDTGSFLVNRNLPNVN